MKVCGLLSLGPTHYRMGEDEDFIVSIETDVVILCLYPATIFLHTRIRVGVLALTGYGIGVGPMLAVSGPDSVEIGKLVHNLQMIGSNAHPITSVSGIHHEDVNTIIIDVQRTNSMSFAGEDGILVGRRFITTVLEVFNVGEPVVLTAEEKVLAGIYWTLSSNSGTAGQRDVSIDEGEIVRST